MKSFLRQFAQAVKMFNRGFYFECHDILELIWLETSEEEKGFYQGLLHIAVGLYHLESRNYKGCISQLGKAEDRLHPFGNRYRGVALKELVEESRLIKAFAEKERKENNSLQPLPVFPQIKWVADDFENRERLLK